MTDGADPLPNMIPDVRNLLRPGRWFQRDEDGRHSSARVAAHEIELWRFLKRPLEPLRDLMECVVQVCTGPACLHDHRLDDESRVLVAPGMKEGEHSRNDRRDHAIDDERTMLERPFREIELHDDNPISRTFWPG